MEVVIEQFQLSSLWPNIIRYCYIAVRHNIIILFENKWKAQRRKVRVVTRFLATFQDISETFQ